MSFIKFINSTYENGPALENVYNYILNRGKCVMSGCHNVLMDMAVPMMYETRKFFGITSGRVLMHIVISPSRSEKVEIRQFCNMISFIATSFRNHQVVYAVHGSGKLLHTHLMVNAVNFRNGEVANDLTPFKTEIVQMCEIFYPNTTIE